METNLGKLVQRDMPLPAEIGGFGQAGSLRSGGKRDLNEVDLAVVPTNCRVEITKNSAVLKKKKGGAGDDC